MVLSGIEARPEPGERGWDTQGLEGVGEAFLEASSVGAPEHPLGLEGLQHELEDR